MVVSHVSRRDLLDKKVLVGVEAVAVLIRVVVLLPMLLGLAIYFLMPVIKTKEGVLNQYVKMMVLGEKESK